MWVYTLLLLQQWFQYNPFIIKFIITWIIIAITMIQIFIIPIMIAFPEVSSSDYAAHDRLVAATRAATTAGAGFPTQSQRRWWSPLEWRFYSRLDKTPDRPEKARSSSDSSPKLLLRTVSEAKGGNQWRTEEDAPPPELAVLCLLDTHTCQQKLVLPRPKEIRKWCSRDFPHLREVYFCYLRGLFLLSSRW